MYKDILFCTIFNMLLMEINPFYSMEVFLVIGSLTLVINHNIGFQYMLKQYFLGLNLGYYDYYTTKQFIRPGYLNKTRTTVLTGAQKTCFFNENYSMEINHATFIHVQHKGIINLNYLADFDKYTINQVAKNLRRLGYFILDIDTVSQAGAAISKP